MPLIYCTPYSNPAPPDPTFVPSTNADMLHVQGIVATNGSPFVYKQYDTLTPSDMVVDPNVFVATNGSPFVYKQYDTLTPSDMVVDPNTFVATNGSPFVYKQYDTLTPSDMVVDPNTFIARGRNT